MSLNGYNIPTTADAVSAQAIADLRRRMAVVERNVQTPAVGPGATVGDATTTVKGKVQLSGNLGGTAAAPYVLNLRNIQTSALTDRVLTDETHGGLAGGTAGIRYSIYHGGGAASRVTTAQPTFHMSRVSDFSATPVNGADYLLYSAFQVIHAARNSSKAQPIAALFWADNDSSLAFNPLTSNTDAEGIFCVGQVSGTGTGRALGGTLGSRILSSASGASGTGVEAVIRNENTHHATNPTGDGSRSMGIWINNIGTYRSSCAIQIGKQSVPWEIGLYVGPDATGTGQGNSVLTSTFRDYGNAGQSIEIGGTHTGGAVTIDAGAGYVGVGTPSPLYHMHVVGDNTGGTGQYIAYFTKSNAAAASIAVDSVASQQATMTLRDGGTTKWSVGKGTTNNFFVFDATGSFSPTTITHTTGTQTLRTGAMTDRLIADIEHGENQDWFSLNADGGLRWQIEHGSSASPVTVEGPTVKISRHAAYTGSVSNGTDGLRYAAFASLNRAPSTTKAQPTAVEGYAVTESTQARSFPTVIPDATAVVGVGRVETAGVGAALGGYFEAQWTSSYTGDVPFLTAVECQARNSAVDSTYDPAVGRMTTAMFLTSSGTKKVSAALKIGHSGALAKPFRYGIVIPSVNDAVELASFRDDGTATHSILINGTHSGGAIAVASASGKLLVGLTTTSFTAKTVVKASGDTEIPVLVQQNSSSQTGRMFAAYNAAGTTEMFAIGAGGNLIMADANNMVMGSGGTGVKIGTATTQKIGFWNVAPVAQPAAYTQTYSTADRTHAAFTSSTMTNNTGATPTTGVDNLANGTVYATDHAQIEINFSSLADQHNKLRTDLEDLKQLVNSLIDDHQAIGLCA